MRGRGPIQQGVAAGRDDPGNSSPPRPSASRDGSRGWGTPGSSRSARAEGCDELFGSPGTAPPRATRSSFAPGPVRTSRVRGAPASNHVPIRLRARR
jgi:hypothetical protein